MLLRNLKFLGGFAYWGSTPPQLEHSYFCIRNSRESLVRIMLVHVINENKAQDAIRSGPGEVWVWVAPNHISGMFCSAQGILVGGAQIPESSAYIPRYPVTRDVCGMLGSVWLSLQLRCPRLIRISSICRTHCRNKYPYLITREGHPRQDVKLSEEKIGAVWWEGSALLSRTSGHFQIRE